MSQQTTAYVCNVDEDACGRAYIEDNASIEVTEFLICTECDGIVRAKEIEAENPSELDEDEIKRIFGETEGTSRVEKRASALEKVFSEEELDELVDILSS